MFIEGLINSENPAADFYAELETALTNVGYTLVDTVAISTRTHKVWESPSSNVFGQPWFLDVVYETTGDAYVWMVPFEDYDPDTNEAFRGPANYYESFTIQPDDSISGDTGYPLEDSRWTNPGYVGGQPMGIAMKANLNMAFWASVTVDRVIVLVSIDAQRLTYAGLFKPSPILVAQSGANHFPLVMGHISTNNYSDDYLAITRWPVNSVPDEVLPMLYNDNLGYDVALGGLGAAEAQGGVVMAREVILGTWGGWLGTFYGVASVPVGAPWDGSGEDTDERHTAARGDVVTTNTTEGSTVPSGEWVLTAPRYWQTDNCLMLKKE